jgi:ribonucleoside-triphosphate reductase
MYPSNTTTTLPTPYQSFIHVSRYARWLDEHSRRETWEETVQRYVANVLPYTMPKAVAVKLRSAILNLEVMPSMRALMSAGPALNRCHVAGYNCSYLPVDSISSFDEALYILMCGTGVGYSVERQYITKLPSVPTIHRNRGYNHYVVEDSKIGWAKALKHVMTSLYDGKHVTWDLSKIRPAGAKLKIFGGRASGPEPLNDLLKFVTNTFYTAQGRQLSSLECHDIMCKVASAVIMGGVRRSAMISLSNFGDGQMRQAKSGDWFAPENQPYRGYTNNSACYTIKPDIGSFMDEWLSLYNSKSGERGIFNRQAAQIQAKKNGRRNPDYDFGTNPCSEIILRPYQFCNLTEVVVRAEDTEETLLEKVEMATILGTIQSTMVDFKYLRKIWSNNTKEERLLGVSLTGILDHHELGKVCDSTKNLLDKLREKAIEVNKLWAYKLSIPVSTAITCVKPSGTVSQLTDSASGIHPRYSEYYIRTVRGDKSDPLTGFLVTEGVPCEDAVSDPTGNTAVFSFPTKSPIKARKRSSITAIEHLEIWKMYQEHWCEHKPSITINVKDGEWLDVGAWVYKNFDICSGISFLPYSDHIYAQAPYQEVSKGDYNKALALMPTNFDLTRLSEFESGDTTVGNQTLACTADSCEVVDIT